MGEKYENTIVEAIKVGKRLEICLVFNQFFSSSVEQTNVWISAHNHFSLEFKNEPEDTVSCRMLRTKVDCKSLKFGVLAFVKGHG